MERILRKYWSPYVQYNWKYGLFLILLFGVPRFILVLHSYVTQSYGTVMLIFLAMWFTPLIFLTKQGRKSIGIQHPKSYIRLLCSFIIGALSCAIIFLLLLVLFDKTQENAFVYISGNSSKSTLNTIDKQSYFWIAALPSMIFSPIGEEFLYRGIIHGSFVRQFGETKASIFDSLAFALTHIAHFGIIYVADTWLFLPFPTIIWVISMFIVSQIFFKCKQFSNSIWGAVAAHSGFNFAMMYLIFYELS